MSRTEPAVGCRRETDVTGDSDPRVWYPTYAQWTDDVTCFRHPPLVLALV